MKNFSSPYVRLENCDFGVKKIILTRPDVKNAFNAQMINDLSNLFVEFAQCKNASELRLVVLMANENDTVFCAGADLGYMQEQAKKSFDENLNDAKSLGSMFFNLASIPCPVICAVKGAAIGGGFGLCACSDFVLAEENAIFATSEVRLGLVPGVISPYIVRKVGVAHASRFMLTGERFTAKQAFEMGLVNQVASVNSNDLKSLTDQKEPHSFDAVLKKVINTFLMAEPNAAWLTKKLIQHCAPLPDQALFDYTASQIALVRSSKEGKEGLNYFFEKKRPHWCP